MIAKRTDVSSAEPRASHGLSTGPARAGIVLATLFPVAQVANLNLAAALVIGGGFATRRKITVREHDWLSWPYPLNVRPVRSRCTSRTKELGMFRLPRWVTLNAGLLALSVLSVGAAAQSAPPTPPPDAGSDDSSTALAKKLQNPIGDLYSFPFQNTTNFNYGPNKGTQVTIIFRALAGATGWGDKTGNDIVAPRSVKSLAF